MTAPAPPNQFALVFRKRDEILESETEWDVLRTSVEMEAEGDEIRELRRLAASLRDAPLPTFTCA